MTGYPPLKPVSMPLIGIAQTVLFASPVANVGQVQHRIVAELNLRSEAHLLHIGGTLVRDPAREFAEKAGRCLALLTLATGNPFFSWKTGVRAAQVTGREKH